MKAAKCGNYAFLFEHVAMTEDRGGAMKRIAAGLLGRRRRRLERVDERLAQVRLEDDLDAPVPYTGRVTPGQALSVYRTSHTWPEPRQRK